MYSGDAAASTSSPVAALKSTSRWATGKTHPFFCAAGTPNALRSSAVSGIEKVEPSTWKVRCPRHRWAGSRVAGRAASHAAVSSAWYTPSGSRDRAWQ